MQYIKHYYVDDNNNSFCCELSEPNYKRHPYKEYAGLDVKVWLKDSEGVDVCLSEVPDSTAVTTIVSPCGKNSVQVLTEEEYNSVANFYLKSISLLLESETARSSGDEETALEKQTAATEKLSEASAALHAL
jgi:hypothetical protein